MHRCIHCTRDSRKDKQKTYFLTYYARHRETILQDRRARYSQKRPKKGPT